jgi:mRNA interferase RelE/StbE
MYRLELSKNAEKYLKKLDKTTRKRILNGLLEIKESPYESTNTKKLVGNEYFRKRVGNYRIIYEVNESLITVFVIDIHNRRQVYKRL